jgi:hypothetical protein
MSDTSTVNKLHLQEMLTDQTTSQSKLTSPEAKIASFYEPPHCVYYLIHYTYSNKEQVYFNSNCALTCVLHVSAILRHVLTIIL